MSERAKAFLDRWISKHLTAPDMSAVLYARACRVDADNAGIPASELTEVAGDLEGFIAGKLARNTDETAS